MGWVVYFFPLFWPSAWYLCMVMVGLAGMNEVDRMVYAVPIMLTRGTFVPADNGE